MLANGIPLGAVLVEFDVGFAQGFSLGANNGYGLARRLFAAAGLGAVQQAHGFEPQVVGPGGQVQVELWVGGIPVQAVGRVERAAEANGQGIAVAGAALLRAPLGVGQGVALVVVMNAPAFVANHVVRVVLVLLVQGCQPVRAVEQVVVAGNDGFAREGRQGVHQFAVRAGLVGVAYFEQVVLQSVQSFGHLGFQVVVQPQHQFFGVHGLAQQAAHG